MTVAEYIKKLQEFPQDAVMVEFDGEWNTFFFVGDAPHHCDSVLVKPNGSSLNNHVEVRNVVCVN